MMSGDSPDTHARDSLLELKDRTPACNTAVRAAGETVTASVLVEPRPKIDGLPTTPTADATTETTATTTPRKSTQADDEAIETAATPLTTRKNSNDKSHGHENGSVDNTDSAIKMNKGAKEEELEEEEGCAVKCLYYTMQCCECTIM